MIEKRRLKSKKLKQIQIILIIQILHVAFKFSQWLRVHFLRINYSIIFVFLFFSACSKKNSEYNESAEFDLKSEVDTSFINYYQFSKCRIQVALLIDSLIKLDS